jgi:hypothetical protein
MRNRSLLALVACSALTLNAQPPACTTQQVPGAITSWTGQPGVNDHIETRPLTQGTALLCDAVDEPGSPLPAGCYVSLENGGHYTLPPNNVMRLPKDGVATLTCNGPSPTCCRVHATEDKSPLKRGDTKPHKQKDESPKK